MYPIPKRPLLPRSLPVIWFLAIAIALASLRFLIADIALVMPFMLHHALERPILLYGHIALAPVALALLPLQFSTKMRLRRPTLHRWLGRLYGVVILLSGLSGFFLAFQTEMGPIAASGLAALAVAWLSTTAVAIYLAIQRDIPAHRRWMIRSAALTLAAVTLRLYLPIGELTVGFDTAYPLICWACWVPNMFVAEWLVRRELAPSSAQPA
ncbi:DUF2306 domain-containing protein [Shimia sagamensis]|uniref:Predicted membrane protein n=1 Tax=Shimia sagamensis TaxID=1566352 RepID=A0ABY1NNB0_9RHOB|nr:DUF2306 domain-containing protein [Shimia sagamensis]SMP13163.1 Predicted membrane protein [Shimia sagamensis]